MYARFDAEEFPDLLPDVWDFFGDLIVVSGFDPCDMDETTATVQYFEDLGVLDKRFFPQYSTLAAFEVGVPKSPMSFLKISDQKNLAFFYRSQFRGDTLIFFPYSKEKADLLIEFLSGKIGSCYFRGYASTLDDLKEFSKISDLFMIVDDKNGVDLFVRDLASLNEERRLLLQKIVLNALSVGEGLEFHKYFAKDN